MPSKSGAAASHSERLQRSAVVSGHLCGELLILGKLVIRHTQAVALKKTPNALKHEGRSMTMMTCSAGQCLSELGQPSKAIRILAPASTSATAH